jgi:hypothetical protein
MAEREEFSGTRIIIAEGFEDAVFVRQLINTPARNIKPFDVWSNEELGKVGGNTGFIRSVAAADIKRNFPDVTDVIFLADNDDDPTSSYGNVCNQIRDAKKTRAWAIPHHPGNKETGDPHVSIWMFPSAEEKEGMS